MAGKITLERKPEKPAALETKRKNACARENTITKRGLISGISQSLAVGISLAAGFYLQEKLGLHFGQPSFVAGAEVLFISAGIAFSYAFIFVLRRCYIKDSTRSLRKAIPRLWANVSYAYFMELGMLYFIKDSNFALGKAAILFGFVIGISLVTAISRMLQILAVKTGREGRKKLIIKGHGSTSKTTLANKSKRLREKSTERHIKEVSPGEPLATKHSDKVTVR
jgi:hypothetical protein